MKTIFSKTWLIYFQSTKSAAFLKSTSKSKVSLFFLLALSTSSLPIKMSYDICLPSTKELFGDEITSWITPFILLSKIFDNTLIKQPIWEIGRKSFILIGLSCFRTNTMKALLVPHKIFLLAWSSYRNMRRPPWIVFQNYLMKSKCTLFILGLFELFQSQNRFYGPFLCKLCNQAIVIIFSNLIEFKQLKSWP